MENEVAQSCPIVCDPMDCTARLLCPWDFPGKNTGVGCHFLLQGIFPTKGLNLDLLHCRQTLCCLSHWNYQTENLKQLCDVQGQEMDFSTQNTEYTLLLPFFWWGEGVCYWSIWTLKDWAMSTYTGKGGTSLLSRLIWYWFALEMNRDHSVIFETTSKYCISDCCWLWWLFHFF